MLVRNQLDHRRDAIRVDLVAIVAELDRRNPPRDGRQSSSVRVVLEPVTITAEVPPTGRPPRHHRSP